jgi:hypothetical protein
MESFFSFIGAWKRCPKLGGLWCLTPFSTIFQLYFVAVSLIGGGNRRTQRKPLICCKSLIVDLSKFCMKLQALSKPYKTAKIAFHTDNAISKFPNTIEIIIICYNIIFPIFTFWYCVQLIVFIMFENNSQKWAWLNGCAHHSMMKLQFGPITWCFLNY